MSADLTDLPGFRTKKTEYQRVLDLPRSVLTVDTCPDDIIDYWTSVTIQQGSTWRLRAAQALALHHLYHVRGLVGAINVGGGKSLISLLAHHAFAGLDPAKAVLMLPAANRDTIAREAAKFAPYFRINQQLRIVSYEELQHPNKGPTLLQELDPDLVICDEAHKIAEPANRTARTMRVLRFAEEKPQCAWVVMSGTLFRKTLRSCAHLLELALRDGSPLPRSWTELENFSVCCDVPRGGPPMAEPWQWKRIEKLVRAFHPDSPRDLMQMSVNERVETARTALYHRTRTAPGVVQTGMDDLGTSLQLRPLAPTPDPEIVRHMAEIEETWMLPSGQELDSPLDMNRVKRQMSMGFYYRWVWPNDVVDRPWLRARNAYARATREVIDRYFNEGVDTPALAERRYAQLTNRPFESANEYKEADRILRSDVWQAYVDAAWDWSLQKHKPQPPTEPVWFSDWMIDHVMTRAEHAAEPAIIWYTDRAVADRLEEKGVHVYRAGEAPPPTETRDELVALSIRSHGTGHNLQGWGRSIVLSAPASADAWEQLLGRLLRHGQERDEVLFEIYAHTQVFADAIITAKRNAEFAEQTSGQPQKILYGDWISVDCT